MEIPGQLGEVAVDAGGIVVAGGGVDLLRQTGQGADEGRLLLGGHELGVGVGGLGDGVAFLRQTVDQGADAGVGILDIIHGVLAVLPDGQVQVEIDGAGGGAGVEEVPGGVHADLIEQVVQGNGLAGALGHADGLTVLEQVHQLHEHHDEAVGAVQAQAVQGRLQAGHMAVVVGPPDVHSLVKAADLQLVAVVGDVGGEVGVEAVGAAEHIVLQVQLVHLLLALALGQVLVF